MLFKAAAAFAIAAAVLGVGPLAGPMSPEWLRVKADLAQAQPELRLAQQANALLLSAAPRPNAATN